MMDRAVSSSADTSFLKWEAVSLIYQNGTNIKPAAATGTKKKFPIIAAPAAPAANKSRDTVHNSGNISSRSVDFRISCTSSISLRKKDFFFCFVSSSISSRIPFGPFKSRLKIFPVKSCNPIRKTRKEPMIMPKQAITCNVSMFLLLP